VRVWNTETGEELKIMHGYHSRLTTVLFSSDGLHIIGKSREASVLMLWDSKTGKELPVKSSYCDIGLINGHTAIQINGSCNATAWFPGDFKVGIGDSCPDGHSWICHDYPGNDIRIISLEDFP